MIFYKIIQKKTSFLRLQYRFYKNYDLQELAIFSFGDLMATNLMTNF